MSWKVFFKSRFIDNSSVSTVLKAKYQVESLIITIKKQ